jgi:oxygen-independent coproporphyrinogen-3 oxidase
MVAAMDSSVRHFYCHIPFCPAKCAYCAFVTHIGSMALVPRYLDALEREFELLADSRAGGPLITVYFGGGTPSMLEPADIGRLLAALDRRFHIVDGAEVTLEAHPSTVDRAKLAGFREAGITRLSMGGESLQRGELAALGRSYAPERSQEVMRWAHAVGFASVALDLMYGLPGQTLQSWRSTLKSALSFGADHLSLYPLSIEPRTIFARRRREGRLIVPEDGIVADMYSLACDLLAEAGFEHYEIANWATPGHQCRHNLAYWQNAEFFGAGVGAHGYLHPARYQNVHRTRPYIDTVLAGGSPVAAAETIDAETYAAETRMLRLRLLREGLDLAYLAGDPGSGQAAGRREAVDRLADAGLVRLEGDRLLLCEEKALLAHEAIAQLM